MDDTAAITACACDAAVHVRVRGRAVAHDCPALRRFVESALAEGARRMDVHLAECEHFDSTFLGTLLCLRRRAGADDNLRLRLVDPSEQAFAALKRMGAVSLFEIERQTEPLPAVEWTPMESEQAGACSADFNRNVVQAHQELAAVEGPLGATYRQIAEMAAQDLQAAQDR